MFWRKKSKPLEAEELSISNDGSIQSISTLQVLETKTELYKKLRKEVDFSHEDIEYYFDNIIEKIACICHALPASQHNQFRQVAGLLEQSLRTGFISQRIAHGMVVSAEYPADARAHVERSWRYVAMLAGLIHPLGVLAYLGAKGLKTGTQWRVEAGPLDAWLLNNNEQKYKPLWHIRQTTPIDESMVRIWILSQLIDERIYKYITIETSSFFNELLSVLTNQADDEYSLLARVMNEALVKAKTQEIDVKVTEVKGLGGQKEERLKDVISIILNEDRNIAETSICTDGNHLYGLWPKFSNRIRTAASKHKIIGIPDDNDELINMLISIDMIMVKKDGDWKHLITPNLKGTSMSVPAMKLNIPLTEDHYGCYPATTTGESIETDQKEHSQLISESESDVMSQLGKKSDLPTKSQENPSIKKEKVTGKEILDQNKQSTGLTSKIKTPVPKPPKKKIKASNYDNNDLIELKELGVYIKKINKDINDIGWWTDKGRALPWPEIAKQSNSSPKDVLQALTKSGIAAASDNKQLPLFHEVMREGKLRTVVIINSENWPK